MFFILIVTVLITELTEISIVDMADVLFNKMEAFSGVRDEKLDTLGLTLLLWHDCELHLRVLTELTQARDRFEGRRLDEW